MSSPTACFDMTHWMKPEPSRSVRKWIFPLERRLCSQPRSRTGSPTCFAMSSMYATCVILVRHQLFELRPRRLRLLQHAGGRPRGGELHQVGPVVADLLHGHQRHVPVDLSLERDQVLVLLAAVVVHVRRDEML